jgi:hypothetical protein
LEGNVAEQPAAENERIRGFDMSSFDVPQAPQAPPSTEQLHVCAECNSELVYPVNWAPTPEGRWELTVRCPECEHVAEGTYDQDTVDRFDDVLDRGTEEILDDLTQLARANMEEEVDRFVEALASDWILPEDF